MTSIGMPKEYQAVTGLTVTKSLIDLEKGNVDERGVAILAALNDTPDPLSKEIVGRLLDEVERSSHFIGTAFELEDFEALGLVRKVTLKNSLLVPPTPISLFELTDKGKETANCLNEIAEKLPDLDGLEDSVAEAHDMSVRTLNGVFKSHIHDMLEYHDHRTYKLKLLWAASQNENIGEELLGRISQGGGDRLSHDLKELIEEGYLRFTEVKDGVHVFNLTKHGKDLIEEFREKEPAVAEHYDKTVRAELTVEARTEADAPA